MDAIVKNFPVLDDTGRPTQKEAEEAVRVLLRWAGEDPAREGLKDTPSRVAKAYREIFGGYDLVAEDVLGRTFEEVSGYDDIVLEKDIPFYSHCEHHMIWYGLKVPILNKTTRGGQPIIHHKPIGNAIPILSRERSYPEKASGRHP